MPILSVGSLQFEFYLPPPKAIRIAIYVMEVSMSAWDAVAVPVPAGGEDPLISSVGMVGENYGSSW